jgi:S1-C subfamily serine protease
MFILVSVALAAEPVSLDSFRLGPAARDSLGIAQEDWTPELSAALTNAGSPVTTDSTTHLVAAVRSSYCLRAIHARSCEISIGWELRLGAATAPIYRVVTRGVGSDNGHGDGATRAALVDAAMRLVSHPRFTERPVAEVAAPPPPPPLAPPVLPVTVKRCTRAAMKLPAEMESALQATVVITSGNSTGSGVLVSPDGWVLTAAHVVNESETPTVRTRSGASAPATIARIDHEHDVALLRTTVGAGACLPFQMDPAPPGTDIFAIGSPLGQALEFSVSKGIISGMREADGQRFIQTDASVNPGNSGGPLLDQTGKLLGIVSWKVMGTGFEGIAFGVPVENARTRLDFTFADVSTDAVSVAVPAVVAAEPPRKVSVDDTPDGPRLVAPKARIAVAPLITGLVAGGAGLGLVGGTFAWYAGAQQSESATVDGWHMAQILNAVGWGLAAGGLGLTVVPLLTSEGGGAAAVVSF